MKVSFVKDNIVLTRADAIVNAANPVMLGGGGVDGAIHRHAGPELRQWIADHVATNADGTRCHTGLAVRTPAFGKFVDQGVKSVICTVGPIFGSDDSAEQLLFDSIANSLLLADELGHKSVALPAISCGVYGGTIPVFAEMLKKAVDEMTNRPVRNLEKVTVYLFFDHEFSQFAEAWSALHS